MGRIPSAAALRGTINTLPRPLRGGVQGGRSATSILSPSAAARLPASSIIRNIAGAASSHSLVVPQSPEPQGQPQPQIPADHQRVTFGIPSQTATSEAVHKPEVGIAEALFPKLPGTADSGLPAPPPSAVQPRIPAAAVTPQAVTTPPALQRFIDAQMKGYKGNATHMTALKEMQQGRKASHWTWYELPIVRGFGQSEIAKHFSLNSLEEVRVYYAHDTLRANLVSMFESINSHANKPIKDIMVSDVDVAKLHSCATIFYLVTRAPVFLRTLNQFFDGFYCQTARQKFTEWQQNE